MIKYKYVFVVLVYKNIDVLRDFFESLNISDNKVIVVNSYFDEVTLKECKEVASGYKADFISIDNKGYGYGNNVGARYAMEHYEYDYLILSNSDIHVRSIGALSDNNVKTAVFAPYTHLVNGKIQNPNIPWRFKCIFWLLKDAYESNSKFKLLIPHMIVRACREVFDFFRFFLKKPFYKIYSCHGSFIIFTKDAAERIYPFFDERMFLYNEELYLAEKCRMKGVPVYYCPNIDVLHLEGASTGGYMGFERNQESFTILYGWMKDNNLI